jgi:hypothetical protein
MKARTTLDRPAFIDHAQKKEKKKKRKEERKERQWT